MGVALKVYEYAAPTVALGGAPDPLVEFDIPSAVLIVIVRSRVAVAPIASVTWNVISEDPGEDGTPLMTPLLAPSESPAGRLPDAMPQVIGAVPPDITSVWL